MQESSPWGQTLWWCAAIEQGSTGRNKPRKFHANITKNFFTVRVTAPWTRLLREVVESPFLEIFKTSLGIHLFDLLYGTCFSRLSPEVPSNLYSSCDSVTYLCYTTLILCLYLICMYICFSCCIFTISLLFLYSSDYLQVSYPHCYLHLCKMKYSLLTHLPDILIILSV